MAQQDIVGGLFGITPESYQQGLAARDTRTNLEAAQLTPGQLAGYYAMEAGTGLGRGVQGLLGVEDPQLQAIRGAQSLLGQFDISTSAGLKGLTMALQQKAQETGNSAYMGMANDAARKYKETLLNEATVQAKVKEQIKQVGLTTDGRQVYQSGAQQFVLTEQGPQPYYGALESKRNKTEVNVTQVGESEFTKQLAKNDADVVKNAMITRDNAINSLKSLNELAMLNDNELISGTYASGRVGAANLLQTLGLATSKDTARLATSEQFQKVGKDLILQTLGGKLGAGFSNEDRKFIEALVPSLENSPAARRQLITFMQKKFGNIVSEVNSLETYARDKKGLGGYNYKTPLPTTSVSPATTGKPTKADIEAEAKKRGIEL